MKNFISAHDVKDIDSLVRSALAYKANPLKDKELGAHKRIGMLFLNPSMRTRLSTQIAAQNLGADAIVSNAVVVSNGTGHPLTGFIVRKEAKQHGLGKWIEGVNPKGKKIVFVEDVVTSGGSLLKAVEHVREAGGEIVVATSVVDREQGGRRAEEEAAVRECQPQPDRGSRQTSSEPARESAHGPTR